MLKRCVRSSTLKKGMSFNQSEVLTLSDVEITYSSFHVYDQTSDVCGCLLSLRLRHYSKAFMMWP